MAHQICINKPLKYIFKGLFTVLYSITHFINHLTLKNYHLSILYLRGTKKCYNDNGDEKMKIQINFEENLEEDEIIIKCKKMDKTIQKIQQEIWNITSTAKKLSFYKDNLEYYLPLDTILFFETSENKINAHTIDDVYQIKYRLYELEEILSNNFLRISKSTIINVDEIYSINRNLTSLHSVQFYKSHKQVYVSRYYFKDLNKRLGERRNYEK